MHKYHFLTLFLFFLKSLKIASGAKILAVCGIASKSHHIWNTALLRELSIRGHEITYFSPEVDLNSTLPKMRQILVEDFYPKLYHKINRQGIVEKPHLLSTIRNINNYNGLNTRLVLESQGFDQLFQILRSEKFDLLIFDFTMNTGLLNVADYMKGVPIVGVCAYGYRFPYLNHYSGSPESLSVLPLAQLKHGGEMPLSKRMQNLWTYWCYLGWWFFISLPQQTELARTKFPDGEDLLVVLERFSLFLINSDMIMDPVIPSNPTVVKVGGLHVSKPKPLPKDVQRFLDESKDGAILFSLGTNIKSNKLDPNVRNIFAAAFEELAPVRVLWKFESDFPNSTSNLMTRTWLPQSDILAHPNMKLFITHSGLLSTQEAIYRGVPILGVPFFIDQFMNIERCKLLGFGEKYDATELDKESFKKAITNMLLNPKYKENAEKQSKIFKDQPETPLERAVFWTEYVIRNKGAPHLRADSLRLSWYQNMLLDVIAITIAALVIPLYVAFKILQKLCRISSRSTKKIKKQ